ncbi:ABC transporter ATP-binding protein/permease [Desulfopila aestuarii]|uniref:Putative ABC transport system ATP-binding protein n=1 Tax=Desulfopila aestuarii DSM 18488 TaxID=1121416 RepID=A0A1M7YIM9_9BACT|nr:ABC transporter ATP-binding protein/permease [Desulfopila aestuarii]SHO52473.1 putative ABC transport system ATP-binding protein [Desulfopila aestuarii DSM 18488]
MSKFDTTPITKRTLFSWIINRFRGPQLMLLGVIIVSLFFRVYPLEMQRKIINEAINLKEIDLLFLYCGLYMAAVLVAGLLKYFINSYQAIIGQKILIEMRQELYNHILRLPLQFFHRTQTGTIISALTAELNAIGMFLGGALAIPVTSFLTFLAFAGYMIYLNPFLGLISMTVYPFELVVVPLLQKRYNAINRTRVTVTRAMANLVNEASSGIHEVQANAGFDLEKTRLDRLVERLYIIMRRLSILKYGIKFSNNLFQSLGPFLLFLIGGYLAINGQFTIGALVAFLSAYEKVYDPWKEIIEYYQDYQDAEVRYRQIMEAFDLEPEYLLAAPDRKPLTLKGHIEARNVGYTIDNTTRLLDEVTFDLTPGSHMALIGFSGSGKSTLSLLIGQLYSHTQGVLSVDNIEINEMTKLDIAKNISFVSQHPFIFTGTVRDNLLYSCSALQRSGVLDELPDSPDLINMIANVGLAEDVIRWGLRTVIPPRQAYPLVDKFLRMRDIVSSELRRQFSHVVEFYDANLFLEYSTLGINLTFSSYPGSPHVEGLIGNEPFRAFIKDNALLPWLLELGRSIAKTTITLLADFQNDEFFFQGSPMEPDQLDSYIALVKKADSKGIEQLKDQDQDRFLALALLFTPGQHKIYTISRADKDRIVAMRQKFLQNVLGIDLEQCRNGVLQRTIYDMAQMAPERHAIFFTPFCASQYLYSHSLLDNIIFGTVIEKDVVQSTLAPLALQLFKDQGLLDEVFEIGLDFHVGSKGDKLSGGQKQKIAIATALLKNAPILILDEATASLDNNSQARIQQYINTQLRKTTTVIAVMHRLDMIAGYDHILVMKAGKVVESGGYTELMKERGILYELVNNS